jgi:hypothetical protein
MSTQLTLTPSIVENVNYEHLGAYRLRVEVAPASLDSDPHIFLFLQRTLNQYTGELLCDFAAVASPADVAYYPVGGPRLGTAYPYFRLDFLELDFRSTAKAMKAWTLIVADADVLCRALDRLDVMVALPPVHVGTPSPPPPSSDSSDSSHSSVSWVG